MYGYIYKTTNLVNGKIYIGQHKADKFDITYFGSGKVLLNAIDKYGKENFICEILEWCETQVKTNSRERYWIKFYNSRDRNIGYNITEGGEGWKGVHHSEYTKQKISEAKIGCHPNRKYIITKETRQKISQTLKAKHQSSWNKGIPMREESKQKLRNANLGKKLSEDTRQKMKGRPAWNKGIPMTEEAKQHLREINTGKVVSRKTVGQFSLDGILLNTYISCIDASRKTGISRPQITKCCLGYRKSASNYIWKYLN